MVRRLCSAPGLLASLKGDTPHLWRRTRWYTGLPCIVTSMSPHFQSPSYLLRGVFKIHPCPKNFVSPCNCKFWHLLPPSRPEKIAAQNLLSGSPIFKVGHGFPPRSHVGFARSLRVRDEITFFGGLIHYRCRTMSLNRQP